MPNLWGNAQTVTAALSVWWGGVWGQRVGVGGGVGGGGGGSTSELFNPYQVVGE